MADSNIRPLTLIIPARNEEECIGRVVSAIPEGLVSEIIVVDGHSTDRTREVAAEAGARVVTQPGKGYGNAILTGINEAKTEYVTMIDADGSYIPEDINKLYQLVTEEDYDIAFGSRYAKGAGSDDDTPIRALGNKLFTWMMRALHGVKLTDALFFYSCAKKSFYESLSLKSQNFELCIEVPIKVHQAGFKYTEIPSFERARIAGESKVNAFWDGLEILWVTVKYRFFNKDMKEFRKKLKLEENGVQ